MTSQDLDTFLRTAIFYFVIKSSRALWRRKP